MNRVFFFDRDGTVMRDTGYPSDPNEVELLPGAAEALREIKQAGYALAMISNQSGVGRGYFSETVMWSVHARFVELLQQDGVSIDTFRYCISAPWKKDPMRKPAPGMILDAGLELNAIIHESFMVGDKDSDIDAAIAAGCVPISLVSQIRPRGVSPHRHQFTKWREIPPFVTSFKHKI